MYIVHTSHHGFRQGQATYITILCRLHSLLLRLLRLLLERGNDLRGKSKKLFWGLFSNLGLHKHGLLVITVQTLHQPLLVPLEMVQQDTHLVEFGVIMTKVWARL